MSSLPSEAKKLEDWTDDEIIAANANIERATSCAGHVTESMTAIKELLLEDNGNGSAIINVISELLFRMNSHITNSISSVDSIFSEEKQRRIDEAKAAEDAAKKAQIEEDFAQLLSDKYDMTWDEYKNL